VISNGLIPIWDDKSNCQGLGKVGPEEREDFQVIANAYIDLNTANGS